MEDLNGPIEHLMIPGPVEVEADVLAAMGRPVVPHYGPQWVPIYQDVQLKLKQVFHTTGDVFLIPGSGSAGMDAVIGSLLRPGDACLVVVNGFFSERMAAIARSRGAHVSEVRAEWGQPVRVEQIRDALEKQSSFQAICVVHHETSTTVLNPICEIGDAGERIWRSSSGGCHLVPWRRAAGYGWVGHRFLRHRIPEMPGGPARTGCCGGRSSRLGGNR